jgi:hypothetical protein
MAPANTDLGKTPHSRGIINVLIDLPELACEYHKYSYSFKFRYITLGRDDRCHVHRGAVGIFEGWPVLPASALL